MTFDQYSEAVTKFAQYPEQGRNLVYPALGIAGEAGELADKIKKLWRNKGAKCSRDISIPEQNEILKEVGDVLWYANAVCQELGVSLAVAAELNIRKLSDRASRGVIKGEGDNR